MFYLFLTLIVFVHSWPRTRSKALGSATARSPKTLDCERKTHVSFPFSVLNFLNLRKAKIKVCDIETHHCCNAELKMPIFEVARDAAASAYTRFADTFFDVS